MNKLAKGGIGASQIFLLVIGIFAFSFLIGEVGAQGEESEAVIVSPEGSAGVEFNPGVRESLDDAAVGATQQQAGGIAGESVTITPGEGVEFAPGFGGNVPTPTSSPVPKFGSKGYFFNSEGGFDTLRTISSSTAWALAAYGITQFAGNLFGFDGSQTDSLSLAAAAGFGVGRLGYTLQGETGSFFSGGESGVSGGYGTWGLVSFALVLYLAYEEIDEEKVEFVCEPWEAPSGGVDCEKCNDQGILPCSEYQCRSLGQACELVNQGSEEERCVWVNPQDVEFPTIQPWEEALLEGYEYTPDNAISPPDRGVIIENTETADACIKAFTPLTFGIETNEPAKCKIDYLNKESFEEMDYFFGGSQLFRENHTQVMSLPGLAAYEAENIEIQNDGDYELFVRCQDKNGNANAANFVFKFCVEDGPDTTAPVIVNTNLINGMPIAHNQTEIDLIVYTNEVAECRWSHLDEDYEEMDEEMSCSKSVTEMNSQSLYECETTLDGLENDKENNFYFKCRDGSSTMDNRDRNTNSESYVFTLLGTIPLVVNEVGPNETVRDNSDPVRTTLTAETSAGAGEGFATCYYKESGEEESAYVEFFNTGTNIHSQDLFLEEGDYEYNIRCIDLGGNADEERVEFFVESDSESPIVVRVFREENQLKLITDEEAECVYDVLSCNYLFDDGISLTTLSEVNHFAEWDSSRNLYVKCRDVYGNQPNPSQCSIVAKPFEIFSVE